MLSFTRIGMPCNGERAPTKRRSESSAAAVETARGFTSRMGRSSPLTSNMRRMYAYERFESQF
jgi:hypothetical protein